MNDFQMVVKGWYSQAEANEGLRSFIAECNYNKDEILSVTSHVTETEDGMSYVFVFKIKEHE
ncbi:hypothetical protein M3152_08370 [Sporosarcina luteola]|uniref:hypothetical protein n=1 Tax=Sporosarcina luteola TaxID=582850 RepID=UPI00203ED743|nr:hypothetical protein [Sporosarcina luteola]MCM3637735.1 hypothetical protein [Sporosarcina luteola]